MARGSKPEIVGSMRVAIKGRGLSNKRWQNKPMPDAEGHAARTLNVYVDDPMSRSHIAKGTTLADLRAGRIVRAVRRQTW